VEELKKRIQEYNDKTGGNYKKDQKELAKKNAAKKKQEKNDKAKQEKPAQDGEKPKCASKGDKQEQPAKYGKTSAKDSANKGVKSTKQEKIAKTLDAGLTQNEIKPTQGCHAPSTLTMELACKEVCEDDSTKYEITVGVLSAINIPIGDRTSSDPYVKVKLGRTNQLKTNVIKKTLNPQWNKRFNPMTLKEKPPELTFELYDHDNLSKDDLLGLVVIQYDQIEWDGEMKTITEDLQNRLDCFLDSGAPAPIPVLEATKGWEAKGEKKTEQPAGGRGKGDVKGETALAPDLPATTPSATAPETDGGVNYETNYELTATVVRAANLPVGDRTSSDPYVKVLLGKSNIHKTKVAKKTLNPTWERGFEAVELTEKPQEIVFQVFDEDKLSKDEMLGEARIAYDELEWDGQEKAMELELSNRIENFLTPKEQNKAKEPNQGAAYPSLLWVKLACRKVPVGAGGSGGGREKDGGAKSEQGGTVEKQENNEEKEEKEIVPRYKEGDVIEANKKDRGRWKPGKIARCNSTGSFDIKYDDGTTETKVEPGRIRQTRGDGSGDDADEFGNSRRRKRERLPNFQERVACKKLWYAMDPLKPQPNGQTLRQMINTCDPNDSGLVYRADLEEILFVLEAPVSSGSYYTLGAGSGEALLSAREVRAVIRMLHSRRDGLINYYELFQLVEEEVTKADQDRQHAPYGYEQGAQDPYATECQMDGYGYNWGNQSIYGQEPEAHGKRNRSAGRYGAGDNAIADAVLGQLHDRQVMQWFQTMDTNHSGFLSGHEFRRALTRFGVALNEAELRWVFARFDTNGDGLISLPEFIGFMESSGYGSGVQSLGISQQGSSHLYQRPPFSPVKHSQHRSRPNGHMYDRPRSPGGGSTSNYDRRGAERSLSAECQQALGARVRVLLQEGVDVDGAFAAHERAMGGTRLPPGAIRRDTFDLTCRELGMPVLAAQLEMIADRFGCEGGYGYGMAGVMYREFVGWALESLPVEWRMRHGYGTSDRDGRFDGYGYGHSGHERGRGGSVYDRADREDSSRLNSERGLEGLAGLNTKELDKWYDEEADATQRKHFDQLCRSMHEFKSDRRREQYGPSPLERSIGGGGNFGSDTLRADKSRYADRVSTPKHRSPSKSAGRSPRHRNVWVGDPLADLGEEGYTVTEKEAQEDMSTTMYIDLLRRTTATTLTELELDHQETVRNLESSRRMDDLAVSWRDDLDSSSRSTGWRTPGKSGTSSGWDDDDDLRVTPRATPRRNKSGWDDASDDDKDGWRTPRTDRRLRY
jgi:Ca2+-binding EF-hand superfamily protein